MSEAKEKKGLTLFFTYREQFDLLSDEQLGKLIRALIDYAENGTEIETEDGLVKMAFSFIANHINLARQKSIVYSNNGKKGGGQMGNSNARKYSSEEAKTSQNEQKQAKTSKTSHINRYDVNLYDVNRIDISRSEVDISQPPTASTSQQQLTDAILIEKYGIDVVQDYKRRVSDYAAKVNRPAMNTLQTVAKWIEQDGVGLADRNEVKFTPTVEHSRDFSTVEDEIFKEYFG